MVTKNDTLVLIVDDFLVGRQNLRIALSKQGFTNFLEAENGAEGLKIIKRQFELGKPIALVMSDLNMPGMTGIELATHLRTLPEFKNLPFILATVEAEPDRIKQVLTSQVAELVTKPLDSPASEQKLSAILSKFHFKV